MGHLAFNQQIAAPVDTVFAIATDLPRAAEHIAGIDRVELLTDGPVGLGTRWRETRTMFGRESTEELAITQFEPPRGYTVSSNSCGAQFDCRFDFSPTDGGTLMSLELDWRAVSVFAKLMSPLSGMMVGSIEKAMRQDLLDLKHAAETKAD
ncbi:Polyketide cyclase / dehydrase and lipid transport [Posidoniimonas polymericola]|uniref:Polyketide cyclase / dehydrase and lipid transport n=1 Tax=Posidoniimonas polymericola TaxID=2528002 RepID=A0A5C5ZF92_9BACT|nr:SRPBCC family protein [Posidoniimonas polymericola]TWT85223.1 Polyketide cyclase / dehydrase and lipid transport [Posidoniimonas polymericola]